MTSLDGVLSIATSGLAAIQGQIAVVSQNVANAGTTGYAEETVGTTSLVAGDQPSGVRLGTATLVTAPALQNSLYAQNAAVAYQTTLSTAMSAITAVEGSTDSASGSSGSLTDGVATLQSDFTTLQSDPTNASQQQTVVDDATALASNVQSLASTYATERQSASDGIAGSVAAINQALSTIGSLSDQIVGLQAEGGSTAGLENQRNAAMSTLSGLVGVKFQEQSNGDMLVMTTSGLALPTDATSGPLSYVSPTLSAASAYVAGSPTSTIPAIELAGADVTSSLSGGTIGAQIQLRDVTLPTDQAELDSFSSTTAQRFDAQGLTLFTDANGNVPTTVASQVGFSGVMQVNNVVAATPSLVSSGTTADASSTLIDGILQTTFGTPSTPVATSGLGPAATLSLPYSGLGSLADLATRLVSSQGADATAASGEVTVQSAVQTSLQTSLGSATAVSTDSEMSKMTALENSYTANAKVIEAVQSMYTDLLDAVDATT